MTTKKIQSLQDGKCVLGIEFGSTNIKAVLLDQSNQIIASGSHQWENQYDQGVWTYPEDAIWSGLSSCYSSLKANVQETYGVTLKQLRGIGISGMMHGYIALDDENNWLVPFRTWRNTITEDACNILGDAFSFHIPQRWTIAHLEQAILNKETHISNLHHVTTLAGYVHFMLTGTKVVGVGEASGIFPIDSKTKTYHQEMVDTFHTMHNDLKIDLHTLFPAVLPAGEQAGTLTQHGALLLDPSGDLEAGAVFAPPEGDAGTGMVATNAVQPRTGNVSAGTSVFAMIVLEQPLSKPYDMIDMVTTPDGADVAMVHVNNCTSDINAWASLFQDVLQTFGVTVDSNTLYETLFTKALQGDSNLGKMLLYNYFSGEHITGFEEGRPLLVRQADSTFNVANVMKANLFSSLATLRMGMNVLFEQEQVSIDSITGHGGLFKTPYVGQVILASAINTPIATQASAGQGGPYGMALLTNYLFHHDNQTLATYLEKNVFADVTTEVVAPKEELVQEFNQYLATYQQGLPIETAAIKYFK